QLQVVSLKDASINTEIPEPFDTLEENASIKSRTIHELTGLNCFSEDTGLEVDALNGEPGVKSARYAGEEKSFEHNIDKLLDKLAGSPDRNAHFRTVISLIWNEKEYLFEGTCEGRITYKKKGVSGFGYDPIFAPAGSDRTFGEMTMDEKNQFSHRKKAADKLIHFLTEQKIPASVNKTI
ncbi:MAG TPA: RdgB/HAM1 family non-canonical purine NTP pyrophosphatase, partial [Puia sp.]|nr:RdgB/HAM1 family non-canonical purine NTP pyrophosphatase [Puia sp.]